MKTKWKQIIAASIIASVLWIPAATLQVIAKEAPALSSTKKEYVLNNSIKASVKSILNEQTTTGSRIAGVVRLFNEGDRIVRVPDYEVRIKTTEGIEYALSPSAANAKAIQPRETVELSYMISVDRSAPLSMSELSWVDVNEFVYPKEENRILSIPVTSLEWKGENAVFSNPEAMKKWGDTFTIPVLSPVIEYTPIRIFEQNTTQGAVTIVGFLAENKSDLKKSIPEFNISGKSDKKVYKGKRLEQGELLLEPGEKRYIHYSIPAEKKSELISLTVLIPESFTSEDKTVTNYSIGQFSIDLVSEGSNAFSMTVPMQAYEWNKPITFDALNKAIPSDVVISMVSLHMHKSDGGGFKAAVAKFKLTNKSNRPVPVPEFQTQLMSENGSKYSGIRQKTTVDTLAPNISYVVYYSFVLPNSENGEQLYMELMDGKSVAPYQIPIASFKTKAQEKTSDNDFYPYKVNLTSWRISSSFNVAPSAVNYTYKLNLEFDINQLDEVVVDQSFSKILIEVADEQGKTVVSKNFPFTGENRLINGKQAISFDSEHLEKSLTFNVYEMIDTPFGGAKRLIQSLKP